MRGILIVITPIEPVSGIGTEQSAASHLQFPVVDAQAAAHAARVFRIHVGIDEIGKIRHPVFGGHFPQVGHVGIVPVKVLCNAVGGNGKRKHPALGVTFSHHLQKRFVKQIQFFLKILVGFFLRFSADNHVLICVILGNRQIQRDIGKRCLETDACRHVNIENKFLKRLLDFLDTQAVVTDKGCKQSIEIGESLSAGRFALKRVKEIDHLPQSAPQMLGGLAFHLAGYAAEPLHQHIK